MRFSDHLLRRSEMIWDGTSSVGWLPDLPGDQKVIVLVIVCHSIVASSGYPLVNCHITMDRSTIVDGKNHYLTMVIFNSYVTNYQRVYPINIPLNHYKFPLNHYKIPLNHYKMPLNHYKIPLNLSRGSSELFFNLLPGVERIDPLLLSQGLSGVFTLQGRRIWDRISITVLIFFITIVIKYYQ